MHIEGKYAHIYVTKADCSKIDGYFVWINPPRIGLDFRKTKGVRGKDFIPNIDPPVTLSG